MIDDIVLQRAYLRWALDAQTDDEKAIQIRRAFFDGLKGVELTALQKKYLGPLADHVDRTLCNIVRRAVQIPLERLEIEQIEAKDASGATYAAKANEWLEANETVSPDKREQFSQYDVHEAALRDSASCTIVGWDGERPTYTRNELFDGVDGQVRFHYSPDTGALLFATKRWVTFDPLKPNASGKTRLTQYQAHQITRFEADMHTPGGWRVMSVDELNDPSIAENPQPWTDEAGEPLGIAAIPFWNPGGSEVDDVLAMQRFTDQSLVDLMTANSVAGFPLTTLEGFTGTELDVGPGAGIKHPFGTKITRIPGADLTPMFNVVTMGMIQIASIIKGWPVYLWTRGEVPSGEALKVLESSLISQVQRKQEYLEASWLSCFELGRKLHKKFTGEELAGKLKIAWRNPETRNDMLKWTTDQAFWNMVTTATRIVPLEAALQEAGWTEEHINGLITSPAYLAMVTEKKAMTKAAMGFNTQGG